MSDNELFGDEYKKRLERRTQALINTANVWSEAGQDEMLEQLIYWIKRTFAEGDIPRDRLLEYLANARALLARRMSAP